jgi:hypothetical protein
MRAPASTALRPLYEATRYLVHAAGGTVDVRIGCPSPALDALLRSENARSGVFLTAANPRSEKRGAAANEAANRSLAAALRQAGYRMLPHEGIAIDGAWRELGFFVLDLAPDQALRWAEDWGQHAIVATMLGGAPSLLFSRVANEQPG